MPDQIFAVPDELRQRHQWVCWKFVDIGAKKPTKVPYDPKSGKLASVTDPATWSSFDIAFNAYQVGGYSGLGFVFTEQDPYTFIDLDKIEGLGAEEHAAAFARQMKIYNEFNSYSEISPSGEGLHVIIKGSIPAGRRRSFIEIYSSNRYATMTGNVYNNVGIEDRQELLTQLYDQMGGQTTQTKIYKGDDVEKFTDDEILRQAVSAVNGDKFNTLLCGNWQDIYPSQSEADIAFINIVGFYTQNKAQIARIFRASKLGLRDKAKRNDYVEWMIQKSFDNLLPPVDIDGLTNALNDKIAAGSSNGKTTAFDAVNEGSTPSPVSNSSISIPPGLMGEIAKFIYAAAPRQVPEIALAGAIGLMAGICGRAYNVSNTGLNQYILLIAATGVGKEAMASGIDKLMNSIKMQVPTSQNFIGPAEISSGQALIKHLSKSSQCFVSILGEFGLRLQSMSSQNANAAEIGLRRMLLDLFNKSGHDQIFRPMIYADRDKNIEATQAPAFSILGESTPERFYGALNEDMISEGLLPRFMLIEYNGPRPPSNPYHKTAQPTFQLIEQLSSLVANAEVIMHAKRVIDIQLSPEAEKYMHDFDVYADKQINATKQEVLRQLWNRAHIKALKIAGLIAVGVNFIEPKIIPEYVKWAIDIVQNDIKALSVKFESGEIGSHSSENKQQSETLRIMKDYLIKDWQTVGKYSKNMALHTAKVIPYEYLNKRLIALACFRHDKMGATNAIKRTMQSLVDSDKIRELGRTELTSKYGTTQRCFVVSDASILD